MGDKMNDSGLLVLKTETILPMAEYYGFAQGMEKNKALDQIKSKMEMMIDDLDSGIVYNTGQWERQYDYLVNLQNRVECFR